MPVRKVGERWLVDIRYRGERYRVRSPGTTKADAQAHETYLRGELATHGDLAHLEERLERAAVPTVEQFADRWLTEYVDVENKHSERRKRRSVLRAHVLPTLRARRLDEVGVSDVQALKAGVLARGCSPKTVNNVLATLRSCMRYALRIGIIAAMPEIRQLKEPRQIDFKFLDPSQVAAVAEQMSHPVWSAAVLVAATAGLRFGELAGLEWGDVVLDGPTPALTVARGFVEGRITTTKTERVRRIPLPAPAVAALRSVPRVGTPVFLTKGHRLRYSGARKRLARACMRAGVPDIGWHALRHSYASELSRRGAPPQAIQQLLGHTTLDMTLRYMHLRPDALRAAVTLLDGDSWAPDGHSSPPTSPPETKTAPISAPIPWSG
jgi:integrase